MIGGTTQSGFSAVELMVTLFVAVVFLAAGHQMYNAIVQDSGETRQRARASNIAYDYLHRYADNIPAVCATATPVNNTAVTPDPEGLTNVRVTVAYSCPQSTLANLTRVQVKVSYGSESQEVVHAMYTSQ